MTRPWITAITPPEAFPGDTLTIRGSRFTANDRVTVGSSVLAPTVNPDESISVTIPLTALGGEQTVFVRRSDGTESNHVNLGVKPELDPFTDSLTQGSTVTLNGRAFLTGAAVLLDGGTIPASVASASRLSFDVPGTGGSEAPAEPSACRCATPTAGSAIPAAATQPRVLEVPFRYGQHNLSFPELHRRPAGLGNV